MTAPSVNGSHSPETGTAGWAAFKSLWNAQEDPVAVRASKPSIGPKLRLAAGSCWVVALIAAFLAWNGAGKYPYVALQLPFLISGLLTVIVLSLAGAALFVSSFLADVVKALPTTFSPPAEAPAAVVSTAESLSGGRKPAARKPAARKASQSAKTTQSTGPASRPN